MDVKPCALIVEILNQATCKAACLFHPVKDDKKADLVGFIGPCGAFWGDPVVLNHTRL